MAQPRGRDRRSSDEQRDALPQPLSPWFWERKTAEELAREQGVSPMGPPETFRIPGVTPDEAEEFIEELRSFRRRAQ
jgi:hypothetical protein